MAHILINAHSNHKCHYIIHVHVQVGACVVSPEHKIVGIGYNGMPNGCSDDELPWNRTAESRLDTKYPYGKGKGRDREGRSWRSDVWMCVCECESFLSLPPSLSHTVCHAELNAILNKNSADVKGCTLYVALFPCNECAKLIIQSGITDILYVSDKYHDSDQMIASRKLLDMAKVRYRLAELHVLYVCN